MLNVLVVDATPGRSSPVPGALAAMPGVAVACIVEAPRELLERVAEHKPDIVLVDTESPGRDVLDSLSAVSSRLPHPIVVHSGDESDAAIRAAFRAGASSYVVRGIAPVRLRAVLRVAIGRFEVDHALRDELDRARGQLAERKLVERAKGILMRQKRATEAQAFAILRKFAMDRGLRMSEAALQVIEAAKLLAWSGRAGGRP